MLRTLLATSYKFTPVTRRSNALTGIHVTSKYFSMASTTTDIANPLLAQSKLPAFDLIQASHVKPAITTVLEQMEVNFTELEANLTSKGDAVKYADVVEDLEKLEDPLDYAWGVVNHLMGVYNSDELREAHGAMQPEVVKVSSKLSQSAVLYKALGIVSNSPSEELDETQRRIIESNLRSMKLSGVGLEGLAKETFNKNKMELAELSTKFQNNMLDATKAFSLVLTNKEDVAGLPQSALALAADRAKEDHPDATPEAGPWKLGLDIPSYLPSMKYLKNRDIREKLYRSYITRAADDNTPLITRILTLKKEQANLLGFNTFAEMSIAKKMAPSVEAVDEMTSMLQKSCFGAAQTELAQLQCFANDQGFDGELALWDVPYWSERQSEHLFGFEAEQLRPYFSLPNVLDGLFGLCSRLYGIKIVPADGETPVWHSDVKFFHILDEESNEHIASFYLDPYSRPETKRGGAWMAECVTRSKVLGRTPVAYLTCNGSPPVGTTPSLMTFDDVTTLFHETGHGLQHMLTRVGHAPAAGINGIEWDAVELPSQFMENWCYDEKTVYDAGMAKHHETGEPLPRELFHKLRDQRTYHSGMFMLRQLLYGSVDLELHHRYDPTTDDDDRSPFDVMRSLAPRFSVMPPLPEDRFLCSFAHIFAGGYAAGYYSYKWAEVLSADAFGAFEEAGLDNEEEVRRVGRRFRDTVLSMGGGKHPSEVYREFRGRDATPDALLRHNGLSPQ